MGGIKLTGYMHYSQNFHLTITPRCVFLHSLGRALRRERVQMEPEPPSNAGSS